MAQQSNPPMKEFRAAGSGVKVAIWRNEVDKDGSTVIRPVTVSVPLQRR